MWFLLPYSIPDAFKVARSSPDALEARVHAHGSPSIILGIPIDSRKGNSEEMPNPQLSGTSGAVAGRFSSLDDPRVEAELPIDGAMGEFPGSPGRDVRLDVVACIALTREGAGFGPKHAPTFPA